VVAVAFVRVLHAFEEGFDRLSRLPDAVKPVVGGLAIGSIGLLFPEIMGVGYDTITDALHDRLELRLLALVLLAKLLATCLTLGSGGSGGVFAPSLFIGAALGGAVGNLAQTVFGFPMASPGAYAVVGMGAVVAATTHAPITAILIIFELTGDYRVILGLMLSCILGTLVAQRLRRESIYTVKLLRRGIDLQKGQEVNVLRQLHVRDILRPEVETIPQTETLDHLCRRMVDSPHWEFFVVDDKGGLVGVVSVDDIRQTLPHAEDLKQIVIASDLMVSPVLYVREDDTLDTAMQQCGKRTFEELPVLSAGESMVPIGTIRRQDVINAYNKEILKVDLAGSLSARIASAAKLRSWETVGDYVLAQVEAPPHICGRPLASLRLTHEREVQIILIERTSGDGRFTFPSRETVLALGDRIVLFGRRQDVNAWLEEAG
jgi:CIC family chloride channel protein